MDLPGNEDGERQLEDEAGRLRKVTEQTRETLDRATDGLVAGASGVLDATRTVANEARDRAGRVANFVREAETDQELKASVSNRTGSSVHRAGDALIGAAPKIGHGAEVAAAKTGQALNAISAPLAWILGTIAGTLGGWWKKASEDRLDLSPVDDEACRAHFAAIAVPLGGMTYDSARPGYALGLFASRNPEYRGRGFDEVEPDLRRGFGTEHESDYNALRDYIRYGYGRGAQGGA